MAKDVQPKNEQELAQDFWKEYTDLCDKHQHQIVVTPAYKARDDGTFSTVLQTSVGRLPKVDN